MADLVTMFRALPLLRQVGAEGYWKYLRTQSQAPPANLPGPTDAEVLASDLRLRRALAARPGQGGTGMTGGLLDQPLKLTLPTLVGTAGGR